MTIQAQHPHRPADASSAGSAPAGHAPADSSAVDRPTVGLASRQAPVVDGFELLDHRTRHRSMAATGAPPGSYLSIEDGDELRLLPLDRPITHIGRGLIADVRIEDSQVSRRHAIIARRAGAVRVLDDRSSNGTYVNGRAVNGAYLNDGDVVRFGRAAFRYVLVEGQRAKTPLRRMPIAGQGRRRRTARVPGSRRPAPVLRPDPTSGAAA